MLSHLFLNEFKTSMTEQKDPGILYIILSVLSAFFGVSNKENYDRDRAYIEKVGLKPYIIAALILAFLFVVSIYGVVIIVLNSAGV